MSHDFLKYSHPSYDVSHYSHDSIITDREKHNFVLESFYRSAFDSNFTVA